MECAPDCRNTLTDGSGSQSKQYALPRAAERPTPPHVLVFLFVKAEHRRLFCCANILLTLGEVVEDQKLMTAVVLLVYALLSPRSCVMSHI